VARLGALSLITSRDNERLKLVRKLHDKRWREKLGLFFVEGEDAIEAATAEPVDLLRAGEDVDPKLLAAVASAPHPPRVVGVMVAGRLAYLTEPNRIGHGSRVRAIEPAEAFLQAVIASNALSMSVKSVLELLYHSPDSPTTTVPPTRSVTLILRSMDGVAYTTGSDLDSDHKEIHFSLDYIHKAISQERKTQEIMGVLTHEMVHW